MPSLSPLSSLGFANSFKGSFPATFLESRFLHWQYHGVGSVSFLAEKADN